MDTVLESVWEKYRETLDKFIHKETRRRIIVAIAVLCVFVSGFLAWSDEHERANNLQQTLNRMPGVELDKQAKIAEARERQLHVLQQQLAEAEARTTQLQGELEVSRKISERQGRELVTAKSELRIAETKIGQLEEKFTPRRIDRNKKIALVNRLKGKSENRIITVKTVNGIPPEGFRYADDFLAVLRAAEWNPKFHGYMFLMIENVAIISRRNDMVAVFLQQQFEEEGIKMDLIETNNVPENGIDIVIGPKT